jgi:uncharacterized protein YuzE
MIVHYDEEVDAVYIQLSDEKPDGVIEVSDGIGADTTSAGKLSGLEILNASKKFDINTILSYSLDVDNKILGQKRAK